MKLFRWWKQIKHQPLFVLNQSRNSSVLNLHRASFCWTKSSYRTAAAFDFPPYSVWILFEAKLGRMSERKKKIKKGEEEETHLTTFEVGFILKGGGQNQLNNQNPHFWLNKHNPVTKDKTLFQILDAFQPIKMYKNRTKWTPVKAEVTKSLDNVEVKSDSLEIIKKRPLLNTKTWTKNCILIEIFLSMIFVMNVIQLKNFD